MTTPPWLRVQFMRHGRIASHQGDIPLTDEGLREVEEAGRRLAATLDSAETVAFLHTRTRRARETVLALRESIAVTLRNDHTRRVRLLEPVEHEAIRNPDLYIGGVRVEMVSTAEAMAEQTATVGLGPERLLGLPFHRRFWAAPDRVGYWVSHADPPGEDADAVARRVLAFALSLRDLPRDEQRRYVCVTHSPVLRALLRRYLLGDDPGEPNFVESVDLVFPVDGPPVLRYRDREMDLKTQM